MEHIELMSPAGSFESLMAAIQGGCDSVYFGAGHLNMRSRSSVNFNADDLSKISRICREAGIKSYLALNTVLFDNEMAVMEEMVDRAIDCGIHAIIASDLSVIQYAFTKKMGVHISTQCNITNLSAVKFFSQFADVMVTARELSLEQLRQITLGIKEQNICGPSGKRVRIEAFAHGALCMAVSGKCYLSLDNYNYSANRGSCLQLCRRSYTVTDKEEGTQLDIDQEYIMSPKDLCTIGIIDLMATAGISVFKIEGRGRSPEYVKTVTRCYRTALDALVQGNYSQELASSLTTELNRVYNRGFWEGYYMGKTMGEWSDRYGSVATTKKVYLGQVSNYFSKLGVAEIKLETGSLNTGEEIVIIGPTTGVYEGFAEEIRVNLLVVPSAEKGVYCSVPVKDLVRRNDKVFKVITVGDE